MENILPRSLIAASLRNVYVDPSKVSAETVDPYFDVAVRQGNRRRWPSASSKPSSAPMPITLRLLEYRHFLLSWAIS